MRTTLALLFVPILCGPLAAQCLMDDLTKILASDGDSSDTFGKSVAMSGARAIVGAKGDEMGPDTTGSAYFLEFNGSSWTEVQKVYASDADHLDNFGWSVAMDANRAVIGAPFAGSGGAAYVFEHDGTGFVETHKLVPTSTPATATLGWSVAISGDVVVVGDPNQDSPNSDAGAAYVFRLNGTTFTEEARLLAIDPMDSAKFGYAVATNSTAVAVGAPFRSTPDPAVYVYEKVGTAWDNENKISQGVANWFGAAIAMDGSKLAVGASHDATVGVDAGAVFLYEGSGIDFNLQATLTSGAEAGDVLGNSVAIDGDYLVAGGLGHSNLGLTASGMAVVYRDVGTAWVGEMLYPPDPAHLGFFGSSVAVANDQVIGSATGVSDLGTGSGAVYTYSIPNLVLDATPESVQAGDNLAFSACAGVPGNLLLFFIMAVNGTPFTTPLLSGSFNSEGQWGFNSTVSSDPNLPNNSVSFAVFSINPLGAIVKSNDATVQFLP
jgi:hypothetical protein